MTNVATREDWLEARKALLVREKELTRLRDELAEARRALPHVPVSKTYRFEGERGAVTLADLFDGRSQLLVQHFMFGPDWQEGCPSCSFWSDTYDGAVDHLKHRDVTFVAVSRGPLDRLLAYRKRMGWRFPWYSSLGTSFNQDFHVSFPKEDPGKRIYNYRENGFGGEEAPGVSAFIKEGETVYHTYSCYSRGLDALNGTYQLLDLAPRGRDEGGLDWPMAWLRRHDQY